MGHSSPRHPARKAMPKRRIVPFVLAASGVLAAMAGLGLLLLRNPPRAIDRRTPAPAAKDATRPLARRGWSLATGDLLEYEIRIENDVSVARNPFAPASAPADEDRTTVLVEGKLLLAIDDARPDAVLGRIRIAGGKVRLDIRGVPLESSADSDLAAALAAGCLVELAPDGVVRRIRSAEAPTSPAAAILAHVLATVQFAVPPGRGDSWTRAEECPTGRYEARYRASADGRASLRVEKTKAFKDLGSPGVAADTEGSLVGRFDDAAGHLVHLEGREGLTARAGKNVLFHSSTAIRLDLATRRRVDGTPAAPPPSLVARPLFVRLEPETESADRQLLGDATAEQVLAGVPAVLAGRGDASRELLRLAACVRLDPKAAEVIAAEILKAPPGNEVETFLLAALGSAGTPAAESVLIGVGERRHDEAATLAALLPTLLNIREPSERLESFVRGIYRDAQMDPMVSGEALLALGSIAYGARGGAE